MTVHLLSNFLVHRSGLTNEVYVRLFKLLSSRSTFFVPMDLSIHLSIGSIEQILLDRGRDMIHLSSACTNSIVCGANIDPLLKSDSLELLVCKA